MLAIKLQRVGRKHAPSYRVVVAEKRSKSGGPPVEHVGSYNPITKEISMNKERINYWLGVGAKPTASIHNLLVKQGVVSGPKIAIKIRKKEETKPETALRENAASAQPSEKKGEEVMAKTEQKE